MPASSSRESKRAVCCVSAALLLCRQSHIGSKLRVELGGQQGPREGICVSGSDRFGCGFGWSGSASSAKGPLIEVLRMARRSAPAQGMVEAG